MKLDFKRVAVGMLAVTAAIVVGCGGSDDTSSDAGSPEDAEAACATLTTDSQDFAAAGEESCEASFQKSIDSGQSTIPDSIEIGDVTTEGDTATVPVTADGQDTDFTTVQEDGSWKIDLVGAATGGGDSSAPSTDSTTG